MGSSIGSCTTSVSACWSRLRAVADKAVPCPWGSQRQAVKYGWGRPGPQEQGLPPWCGHWLPGRWSKEASGRPHSSCVRSRLHSAAVRPRGGGRLHPRLPVPAVRPAGLRHRPLQFRREAGLRVTRGARRPQSRPARGEGLRRGGGAPALPRAHPSLPLGDLLALGSLAQAEAGGAPTPGAMETDSIWSWSRTSGRGARPRGLAPSSPRPSHFLSGSGSQCCFNPLWDRAGTRRRRGRWRERAQVPTPQ